MRKVNRILVPIDFSEESVRALKYAVSLAEETRSELVALHVIEKTDDSDTFMSSVAMLEGSPFPVSEFPAVPVDVLLQERSLDLWNFIGRTVKASNPVKITKKIRMGSLLKEMTATIQTEHVDLVVIELRKRMSFPNLRALKLVKTSGAGLVLYYYIHRSPTTNMSLERDSFGFNPNPKKLLRRTVFFMREIQTPFSVSPRPKPDHRLEGLSRKLWLEMATRPYSRIVSQSVAINRRKVCVRSKRY